MSADLGPVELPAVKCESDAGADLPQLSDQVLTVEKDQQRTLEEFVADLEKANAHVVVIIPAHDVQDSIAYTVEHLQPLLHGHGGHRAPVSQIFVINDRSNDNTAEAARAAGAVVLDASVGAQHYKKLIDTNKPGSRKGAMLAFGTACATQWMDSLYGVPAEKLVIVFADGNLARHVIEANGPDWAKKDDDGEVIIDSNTGRPVSDRPYPHIIGNADPIVRSMVAGTKISLSIGFAEREFTNEKGEKMEGGRTRTKFVMPEFRDPRNMKLFELGQRGIEGVTSGEYAVRASEMLKAELHDGYAIEVSIIEAIMAKHGVDGIAQVRNPKRSKNEPRAKDSASADVDEVRGSVNSQGEEIALAVRIMNGRSPQRDEVPFERPDGSTKMVPVFWEYPEIKIEGLDDPVPDYTAEPIAIPIEYRQMPSIVSLPRRGTSFVKFARNGILYPDHMMDGVQIGRMLERARTFDSTVAGREKTTKILDDLRN